MARELLHGDAAKAAPQASISEEALIDELADDLLRLCIEAASGRYRPKAVQLAQYDFIPWKRGVSL